MPSPADLIDNPEVAYDTPAALMKCSRHTPVEKRVALEQWAFTVRARVDAVSEGMMSRPKGSYARDVELLRQIEEARGLIEHAIQVPGHTLPKAENRSWTPGHKGQGADGFSSGYGGSAGPGTGPSGPERKS